MGNSALRLYESGGRNLPPPATWTTPSEADLGPGSLAEASRLLLMTAATEHTPPTLRCRMACGRSSVRFHVRSPLSRLAHDSMFKSFQPARFCPLWDNITIRKKELGLHRRPQEEPGSGHVASSTWVHLPIKEEVQKWESLWFPYQLRPKP